MPHSSPQSESAGQALRVSRLTLLVNLLLSAFKLAAGRLANSSAMVSDGIHSASDVLSTLIVMVGIRISSKEADGKHRYGHERLESIAAMVLAMVLAGTGLWIGREGVLKLFASQSGGIAVPGLLALAAAILSFAVKEGMFWYTRRAADRVRSAALMADAWHHRSDALSSIGSLIGIAGARLGLPMLDPLASLVICVFILKAAFDIFLSAARQVIDQAVDPELEQAMRRVIRAQPGVLHLDLMRSRQFGSRIYLDVEIAADGNLSLFDAHNIAERVHRQIEASFPDVKHCMVHVNPLSLPEREPESEDEEPAETTPPT